MKFYKLSSLIALALSLSILSACGPNSNPVVGANGTSLYPGTIPGTIPGVGTTTGIPIYSGNVLVGYRNHTIVAGGQVTIGAGSDYQTSVSVAGGNRVYINGGAPVYYEIGYCWGSLASKYVNSNWAPLSSVSVTFNGSPVTGVFVAQTSGTLTVKATPTNLNVGCGSLYNNRIANPYSYVMKLTSPYYSTEGSSLAELDVCTSTTGAAMACP